MFEEFLREIAPYVIVVGSFARMEETEGSDIDCYLRNREPSQVNPEIGNDTYMQEILEIIQRYGFYSDSVLVGHIAVERQYRVPRMVEISSYYRVPLTSKIFTRELYGVKFLCAVDDKGCPIDKCYDYLDWSDDVGDMVIYNRLPVYE